MPKVILKPNRQKSVLQRHPWIFSGAIANVIGSPESGETVRVLDSKDHFLCWAAFNPSSQIAARIWSWDEKDDIDEAFVHQKICAAIQMRNNLNISSNAYRLVFAESDGLPGLIVDQYDNFLVIQILTAGIEYWKDSIVSIVSDILDLNNIYERSDVDVRRYEGLEERAGRIKGKNPPDALVISEHGKDYLVDIKAGHKTGFYLDQRDNRPKIANLSANKDMLDCFSYTGAFSVTALAHGAKSVVAIDSSNKALQIAHDNIKLNKLSDNHVEYIEGDVFQELRFMRDRDQDFDLIVLDPPKFAPTKASVHRASRGYKDLNLLALKLLRPGGYLVTFSCSGGMQESLFQKIIADAAVDASASALMIDRLHQASDHPVGINFPEGSYLKGFIIYKRE